MFHLKCALLAGFVFALMQPLHSAQPVQLPTEHDRFFLKAGLAVAGLITAAHLADLYVEELLFANFSKKELYDLLISSLSAQDYEEAYLIAIKNPKAVHDIALDPEMKHKLEQLIEQEELKIINETVQASSLLYFFQPSASTQLQYLADLLKLIEQSTQDRP